MRDAIERYWRDLETLTGQIPLDTLAEVAELLLDCHACGGTIFIVGNGGSAATASHLACDLAKNTRTPGAPPFRVVALTDNVPLLTAWGNDHGYDSVFAEQLAALVRPGDVLLVISASGNSPNVLEAAMRAREAGATTLALTGASGGRLHALAAIAVLVPSDSIELVEDAHMAIAHSLCVALRARLRAGLTIDRPAPLAIELGGR